MARKKIVIETEPRTIAMKDLANAKDLVLTGMTLARELTDGGTVFDLSKVRLRVEYDTQTCFNLITAEVEDQSKPVESWQSRFAEAVAASRLSIVRAEGGEGVRIPNNTSLEELHMIRDAVQARIDEVEERIDGGADPAPAELVVDIASALVARVSLGSTDPADIVAAVNRARRMLLLTRLGAGLAPTEADGLIEYKVKVDPYRTAVTALYPKAPEPF